MTKPKHALIGYLIIRFVVKHNIVAAFCLREGDLKSRKDITFIGADFNNVSVDSKIKLLKDIHHMSDDATNTLRHILSTQPFSWSRISDYITRSAISNMEDRADAAHTPCTQII